MHTVGTTLEMDELQPIFGIRIQFTFQKVDIWSSITEFGSENFVESVKNWLVLKVKRCRRSYVNNLYFVIHLLLLTTFSFENKTDVVNQKYRGIFTQIVVITIS